MDSSIGNFRKITVFVLSVAAYVAGVNLVLGPTLVPTTLPWFWAGLLAAPFFAALVVVKVIAEAMKMSTVILLVFASWLSVATYLLMRGPLPFFQLTEAPEWLWSVGLAHGFAIGGILLMGEVGLWLLLEVHWAGPFGLFILGLGTGHLTDLVFFNSEDASVGHGG